MRGRDTGRGEDDLVSPVAAQPAGRILVVGGAGFIGSHVVDELVAAGREVRVLDVLHPLAHSSEPSYLNPAAEYLWGDVREPATAAAAVAGVDAVSHQAAMVGIGVDMGDVAAYASHNDLGTAVLLGALHEARFAGRLVLGSSMAVYGEGRYRCARHGVVAPAPRDADRLARGEFEPRCARCDARLAPEPVPETAATDPRNVYAATKLHQEHLCAAWARETEATAITLRYHNVYGPRMPRETPYAGVASIFRSALAAGRAPHVFEDGAQLRDFVHVADVARANLLALDAPREVPGPVNVASGTPHSVGDLARELSRALHGPRPKATGEFRLGDVRHVFAATERARQRLGFEAVVDFESGVAEFATAPLRAAAPAAQMGVRPSAEMSQAGPDL
jgi:dTDP-L-rhamnose 4-epimerase